MNTILKLTAVLALIGLASAAAVHPLLRSAVSASRMDSKIRPEDLAAIQKADGSRANIIVHAATDMPAGNVLNFARTTAGTAIDANVHDDVASQYIAEQFAKTFQTSPTSAQWDCIVGDSFSAFVTRAAGRTFFAKVNQKTVLLYQTQR